MKRAIFLLHVVLTFFLAGCWDQNLLKDTQLVYTAGYDQTEEGDIQATTLAPPVEEGGVENEVTVTGRSMLDTMYEMDLRIAEYANFSKLQTVLIGESLAADSVYPFLDELYRNPDSNLHARLALVALPAVDLLSSEIETQKNKSEYFKGILESSELTSVIPYMSLQEACTIIFSPERDLYLPYLTYDEKTKRAKIDGLALFHQKKFTEEYLNTEESVIFNILNNDIEEVARITRRVHEDRNPEVENWITIEVKDAKSNLKVNRQLSKLRAEVTLEIVVLEYGQNKITNKKEKELTNILSDLLAEDIRRVLKKLQSSKSDALGLGSQVASFNAERWDEATWSETYQQLDQEVDVDIKLISTGIIE
ncbi:Ger(x)C family spore germination protein [Jeotgalibacillus terrae]|uniref:Ger(X)C family spore germination protein n=1 Tax=Jeotgalibacillus terrae TaxID=587735 RepID=A0ABW5ZCR9_9BACL|nr:Ger(x)C family spore germination protein [Jeotgalibacillus terrae]MBM7579111.1 Ger(x)C family germination protein [Jeotgalibacillus terrae]